MENINLEQLPWWGVLLVIFISTGGLTSVIGFLKWLIERTKRLRKEQVVPNTLASIQEIYQTLDSLRTRTDGMRVVVLKLSNGGDVPKPSSPMYSSILFETTENGVEQLHEVWQLRLVDKHYTNLILKILEEGHMVTRKEDLEQSILKDLFETHGIFSTVTYPLYKTEKNLFLLSIDFGFVVDWDAPKREAINAAIGKIITNMKKI